jgi:hypothetical protein
LRVIGVETTAVGFAVGVAVGFAVGGVVGFAVGVAVGFGCVFVSAVTAVGLVVFACMFADGCECFAVTSTVFVCVDCVGVVLWVVL